MDYDKIIEFYVKHRCRPPHYLIAVLINDLYGAVKLVQSTTELKEVVNMVHKFVPTEARGSIHAVEQWIGEKI